MPSFCTAAVVATLWFIPYCRRCSPTSSTLFGHAQILETPELDASVARGAALASYWRHARGVEIVPPIIAEEIGILTLNDKPVTLLDSGHLLPFPDENGVHEIPCDFYVPCAGARQLLVPVYTGRQRSSPRQSSSIYLRSLVVAMP